MQIRFSAGLLPILLAATLVASAQDATPPATHSASTSSDPAVCSCGCSAHTGCAGACAFHGASDQRSRAAAATLNQVLDRVVQREHFFMAQMRHMHPMVETYLQDLKNDSQREMPRPLTTSTSSDAST